MAGKDHSHCVCLSQAALREGEAHGNLALNAPEGVAALSYLFLFCCIFLQRRKLDAVYYYMRSLAASNPILTAKESLMSLFEETKRKVSLGAGLWGAAPACAICPVLERMVAFSLTYF